MSSSAGSTERAAMVDGFGRTIDYLRLSVTDRCNFRCVYCLPDRYQNFSPSAEMLSNAEILRLARVFAATGVRKFRVTGGEPLIREGILELLAGIAATPGVEDLALSTNGALLRDLARPLKDAGVRRVNVSLDTLDPRRFAEITRFGRIEDVLAGLDAALEAGLDPVKINVVAVRGVNDGELAAFARLTEDRPVHVRFIELMPMGETGFYAMDRRLDFDAMRAAAGPLEDLARDDWPRGHGPARYWRRPGARGTLGFITALSCGFCHLCNRLRLSCKGRLVPCLDGADGADLRGPLRSGASDAELAGLLRAVVAGKPEKHAMVENEAAQAANPRFMCQIGG